MKKIISLMGIIIFVLGMTASAEMRIKDVKFGFDGNYKMKAWTPVKVVMENNDKDVHGELSIIISPQNNELLCKRSVDLPKNSKQVYWLYPFQTDYIYGTPEVRFDLRSKTLLGDVKTDEVVATISNAQNINESDQIVLVVGEEDGGLNLVSGNWGSGQVHVIAVPEEDLPDKYFGYDGVDLMIMSFVRLSSLSQAQKSAITDWIMDGGKLFISSGQNAQIYKNSFLESLLPVELGSLITTPFPISLETFFDSEAPFLEENKILLCDNSVRNGRVFLSRGDTPILVSGNYGMGEVVFAAFDVASKPFRKWDGRRELIRYFLDIKEQSGGYSSGNNLYNDIFTWISSDPSIAMPSFGVVLLFVIIYIIFVGPVNYFWLKKKGKLEFAWISIPIIVIIFSLIAMFIGYAKKGTSLVVRSFSVVETDVDMQQARAETYFSIFSPKKATYTVKTENEKGFFNTYRSMAGRYYGSSDFDNIILIQEEKTRIEDLDMNMWTMKALYNKTFCDLGNGFEGNLTMNRERIFGKISNNTPYDFEAAYLVCFGEAVKVELGKGTTDISVSFNEFDALSSVFYNVANNPGDREIYTIARSRLENSNPDIPQTTARKFEKAILVTILREDQIVEIDVEDNLEKSKGVSIFYVNIPLKMSGESIPIYPNLTKENIVSYRTDSFYSSYGTLKIKNGAFVNDFILPQIPEKINNCSILLGSNTGLNNFELNLYNWNNGSWDIYTPNRSINIYNPEEYFYSGILRTQLITKDKYIQHELNRFELEVNADFQ